MAARNGFVFERQKYFYKKKVSSSPDERREVRGDNTFRAKNLAPKRSQLGRECHVLNHVALCGRI
jgi:hypothetical protein